MARNRSPSPARARGSPPRRSPSSRRERERSPGRHRSSRRTTPPPIDKHSTRTKSPKQRNSASRSPSPRTKRLRRAESERDAEKKYEREHRNGSRRSHDREKGSTRETDDDRRERRPERDEANVKSSRSRDERSESPRHRRSRHRSRSPAEEMENTRQDEIPDGEIDSVSKMEAAEKALEQKQKQKPSFELSGKLADETNRVKGVTLLFNEPPDARKPDVRWRLYVFKAGEVLNEPLYIHRQSVYLFGRERRVADIPTDHPSCSKQHAVIQFRQVEKEQPDGMMKKHVLPYLMDLGSTNKTFLNENAIEPQRYYELFEKDTIKFGNSSREYVLLHENSAT